MRLIRLLAVWLLVLATLQCQNLTLPDAIRIANDNHPLLRAGLAGTDAAIAAIRTAQMYPNPEFGAISGAQTYRVPGNVSGWSSQFSFNQPLELGGLRSSRIQLAERGRDSSQTALEGVRLAVLSGVRRVFFQVLRKRGEIGILTENLRLVEDLRQRIQVRVDVGEAGRLELVRADAEVATARTAANSARLQEVTALSQLRAAIGAPAQQLDVQGMLDPPRILPPIEEVRAEALDRHPALALARSEVRRAEARTKYEVALRRPQPLLRAEIEVPPDVPSFRAGISIPIPLMNRREGPIAEATAQARQVSSIAERTQQELLAALESAYGRYQLAGQQLAAFEQGLIQEAEEALRASEVAYQLGERGILEVLDSQRVLRTVRLDLLSTQYDRQAALIDLDELRAVDLRNPTP